MLRLTRGIPLIIDHCEQVVRCGSCDRWDLQQVPVVLWVTLEGVPHKHSGLVINVWDIKAAVCQGLAEQQVPQSDAVELLRWFWNALAHQFHHCKLFQLKVDLGGDLSIGCFSEQADMIQLTRKYELAASHRLFQAEWDAARNAAEFGKCSNPKGHGHNYMVEVTLQGKPRRQTGELVALDHMDRVVQEFIIQRFDHKNLNEDTVEFARMIPTVENMVKVFWDLLIGKFGEAFLYRVAVWETPQTYAEYFGPGAGPLRFSDAV